VLSVLQLVNIIADGSSTNANVSLDLVVVAQCKGDLVNLVRQLTSWSQDQCLGGIKAKVNSLQCTDGEGGRLTCS